jgi:hypothetical protein
VSVGAVVCAIITRFSQHPTINHTVTAVGLAVDATSRIQARLADLVGGVNEPIAALCPRARSTHAVGAVVIVGVVAVVAAFDPGLHEAIAALSRLTSAAHAIGASVCVVPVTVIAAFAALHDPVSAHCRLPHAPAHVPLAGHRITG